MNDDSIYILDLMNMQVDCLTYELRNTRMRPDKFDRFSYSVWAITETLDAIAQYGSYHYITVHIIVTILKEQQRNYQRYYNANRDRQKRYMYALESVEYLLRLTRGFLYE